MVQTSAELEVRHWVDAAQITLDDELGAMLPWPWNPEQCATECAPAKMARNQPFLVWRTDAYRILLVGYERFPHDRFARIEIVNPANQC